jgi:hypothetical protein
LALVARGARRTNLNKHDGELAPMKLFALVAGLFLSSLGAEPAVADTTIAPPRHVMILAKPTRVKFMESLPDATESERVLSIRFAVTLEVQGIILGDDVEPPERLRVDVLATGEGALQSRSIHVLRKETGDGRFVVEHWGDPATIACIPEALATSERRSGSAGYDVWFRRYSVPSQKGKCVPVRVRP